MCLTHPTSIIHQLLIGIMICNYPHLHLRFLSLLLELMQLYIQCTDCHMGLWDDNDRWLTTTFIYSHWNCWNCIFVIMVGDWHEFCVDAWMNWVCSSDMMYEQTQIWNMWVNDMFPMQCIAYMSPIFVMMHGDWQEFRWNAWMNWVYSSDTINESNANLEYIG
jgi:hypothetical protein